MAQRDPTIAETTEMIRSALREYIEAAYHVGNPQLVRQRSDLLKKEGVLYRSPYIESTPRYTSGSAFSQLALPEEAKELFTSLSSSHGEAEPLLHDPPYLHQAHALEMTADGKTSVAVTTGTGSGKTETFLLPILSRLAAEAASNPSSFRTPAVRALLLYPMNALVNDQLGRLRLLFGDPRVSAAFEGWAGRPARFARYTSRTLYPGVRSSKKDSDRLKPLQRFYLNLLAESECDGTEAQRAKLLIESLKERGKWPAKPDLRAWLGEPHTHWQNSQGEFVRAILGDHDAEALTRHEVLEAPPDLLVTNYSMLEYMLMRPLERPVFDATRQWLAENPNERLMLIVDEAHLYRGAAGAEVGLLLRRLRARLGIEPTRVQVICTSASFADPVYARSFAAQLTGKKADEFEVLTGTLAKRADAAAGERVAAEILAKISTDDFHSTSDDVERLKLLGDFLAYRGVEAGDRDSEQVLYEALQAFPPMGKLVNLTMDQATRVEELGKLLFPDREESLADSAVSTLIALGSFARRAPGEPSMLPCRVHSFLRGLPGLWACLDPDCDEATEYHGSPVGALYSQPESTCGCGARVFELFTCRNCGTAYARAYTDDLDDPTYLWPESGVEITASSGTVGGLEPIDLLLEPPTGLAQPADLDLVTGRLNPRELGERWRQVHLRADRTESGSSNASPGQFVPCGVCGTRAGFGRSSVQDHQTKGDQPFQVLLTEQIAVQPPGKQPASDFAPLRGRKVLVFSDSRQTAARLAPNLQQYSMQDSLRPVIVTGWRALRQAPFGETLSLDDLYLATLVGAHLLSVRIRPQLTGVESPRALQEVGEAISAGALEDPVKAIEMRSIDQPPRSLLKLMVATIVDRHYGMEALALASLRERDGLTEKVVGLPDLPGVAENADQKLALARGWIRRWIDPGIWFNGMGLESVGTKGGVRGHSGKFKGFWSWLDSKETKKDFETEWLEGLRSLLCEAIGSGKYRMRAANLVLELGGEWRYCQHCRTPQRGLSTLDRCINCAKGPLLDLDPDADESFGARKGYYRRPAARVLHGEAGSPMALVAAEHTAQLNAAQADDVFSKAEEHELLFQDLEIHDAGESGVASAIDVLSCTTTMEVGIDIGALSGVALRNLPPSRSSYQQRAGRAGRRGNAIATVLAFGSSDSSHDEHYFKEPDAMIRGEVQDPVLTLDNAEIARRHVTAYLLQRYHQNRLPEIDPSEQPQLFEVLGSVESFKSTDQDLNRSDFGQWLQHEQETLVTDVEAWLPDELGQEDREALLAELADETLCRIDDALEADNEGEASETEESESETLIVEGPPQEEEEVDTPSRVAEKLLDRLLYKGVLPRYAFPTDVVAFHVFDRDASTRFRPQFQYSPSQGLPTALSQYAPGKEVWIDGKLWKSGALYSVMRKDRDAAWERRRIYFECTVCGYALTKSADDADRGQVEECPACRTEDSFGESKYWLRPPGFAHPTMEEEETSGDDQPARSYATRAKLVAPGPADESSWQALTERIHQSAHRTRLLVTNTGPRRKGYSYCLRCGLIEPTAVPESSVGKPHPKPYPGDRDSTCQGMSTNGLVLGTDFISDVLLVRMRVDEPVNLRPELLSTKVALRTVAEAMMIVAAKRLELEPGDLQAEHRPALSPGGGRGLEAEIYIYDTLAGGAGFAHRVGEIGIGLFEEMIDVLEGCPSDCDRSCYRCLRSFTNRFEHGLLDRHIGAGLLRYLVAGEVPVLSSKREALGTQVLRADLERLGRDDLTLSEKAPVRIPDIEEFRAPLMVQGSAGDVIVALHDPLTPGYRSSGPLREAKEKGGVPVVLVDELLVSRNLPAATKSVLDSMA
jgi:ATP-dependent helicase YprA (DUF1998 family)